MAEKKRKKKEAGAPDVQVKAPAKKAAALPEEKTQAIDALSKETKLDIDDTGAISLDALALEVAATATVQEEAPQVAQPTEADVEETQPQEEAPQLAQPTEADVVEAEPKEESPQAANAPSEGTQGLTLGKQGKAATGNTAAMARQKPPALPQKPPKTKEQLDYEAARKEHFKAYYWTPFLRPMVALLSICLVTSLLLGLTNAITQPVITANAQKEATEERKQLLPEADDFLALPIDGLAGLSAAYEAKNGAGWVFEAFAQGYGGIVPVMVAFDGKGNIVGVTFMENTETVGLGQKVREPEFGAQFIGLGSNNISLGDIDKIASATISTGAAVNAVNAAIDALNRHLGKAEMPTSPDAVREYLLPGEVLVPISISAENVQAVAWRSDKGNYIIYGEKPSEREGSNTVVVAAVAVAPDGAILNLWIDTSGEGEQYGQTLAKNRAFLQSFVGLFAPVEVDVVADISNSSRSVMQAVNTALSALPLAKEAA